MALHVEEINVSESVQIEFVSQFDDERWEELEQRGLVAPDSDAILLWYDEVVMLSGTYDHLVQFSKDLRKLTKGLGK